MVSAGSAQGYIPTSPIHGNSREARSSNRNLADNSEDPNVEADVLEDGEVLETASKQQPHTRRTRASSYVNPTTARRFNPSEYKSNDNNDGPSGVDGPDWEREAPAEVGE